MLRKIALRLVWAQQGAVGLEIRWDTLYLCRVRVPCSSVVSQGWLSWAAHCSTPVHKLPNNIFPQMRLLCRSCRVHVNGSISVGCFILLFSIWGINFIHDTFLFKHFLLHLCFWHEFQDKKEVIWAIKLKAMEAGYEYLQILGIKCGSYS